MDEVEWIDIVRTAYQEFDVYPKDTVVALLRVVRAAEAMVCHKNSPKWKDGLIPWREIAEGVDVDDLCALAEALDALPKHLRGDG